jgi:8-oxo-dGTP pyrophosphatase MutT (NUDIX family)
VVDGIGANVRRRLLYLRSKIARTLYRWLPIKMNGAVGVVRSGDKFLLIQRADGMGYCFPGGLARRHEAAEETVRRELLEETGLRLTAARFLFRYPETGGFSEFTSVYEISAQGELRGSGEGTPGWLTLSQLATAIYEPQRPVLKFLMQHPSEKRESE